MFVPMVSFLECNPCSANLDIVDDPKCKICEEQPGIHEFIGALG